MNILILANSDIGLYKFRKDLIQELLINNYVYIALPYGKMVDPLIRIGCKFINTPIDRRGINPFKDVKLIINYRKVFLKIKPDLVISYTIKPNIYGGFLSRIMNIQYIVNITGLGSSFEKNILLRSFVSKLYKFALKKVKIVFFENDVNRNLFINQGIVKNEKTYTLHGAGVNLEEYSLLELPKNEVVNFIFIGRIMKEKGIDELFNAMHQLYVEDNLKFVLNLLGDFEENYKDKVIKYEKEGWLKYYGYQKNIKDFIKKSNCLILPSWHEGMSNTILECASCGRPIITSNIPGCREAVIHKKNGYLIEVKNVESLKKAIKDFISLSYNEQKEMGLLSRKIMEKNFDKKFVIRETITKIME